MDDELKFNKHIQFTVLKASGVAKHILKFVVSRESHLIKSIYKMHISPMLECALFGILAALPI